MEKFTDFKDQIKNKNIQENQIVIRNPKKSNKFS